MVRKLLLATALLLTGCGEHNTSTVTGKLLAFDCKAEQCIAVVYSKGVFDQFSIQEIPTCNQDYSGMINTSVAIVRSPVSVPVIQKSETALRQCYKVYPFTAD